MKEAATFSQAMQSENRRAMRLIWELWKPFRAQIVVGTLMIFVAETAAAVWWATMIVGAEVCRYLSMEKGVLGPEPDSTAALMWEWMPIVVCIALAAVVFAFSPSAPDAGRPDYATWLWWGIVGGVLYKALDASCFSVLDHVGITLWLALLPFGVAWGFDAVMTVDTQQPELMWTIGDTQVDSEMSPDQIGAALGHPLNNVSAVPSGVEYEFHGGKFLAFEYVGGGHVFMFRQKVVSHSDETAPPIRLQRVFEGDKVFR